MSKKRKGVGIQGIPVCLILFVLICLYFNLSQAQSNQPTIVDVRKIIPDISHPSVKERVEVWLSPNCVTLEKSMQTAFFDKKTLNEKDHESFYLALKVWKQRQNDEPSGRRYRLIKPKPTDDMPIVFHDSAIVHLLIKYKVDEIFTYPEWECYQQPEDYREVYFYPEKQFAEDFFNEFRELSCVLKCNFGVPEFESGPYVNPKQDCKPKDEQEKQIKEKKKDLKLEWQGSIEYQPFFPRQQSDEPLLMEGFYEFEGVDDDPRRDPFYSVLLGNLPESWRVESWSHEINGIVTRPGNTFLIRNAVWDNQKFQVGDAVGFFNPRDVCIAHAVYNPGEGDNGGDWDLTRALYGGSCVIFHEWEDEEHITEGLRPGEKVKIKLWDASEQEEIEECQYYIVELFYSHYGWQRVAAIPETALDVRNVYDGTLPKTDDLY